LAFGKKFGMKNKFTEAQIVFALRQAESGPRVPEVCRKTGISEQMFYRKKRPRQLIFATSELS
jgi:hypothetical protein